MAMDGIIPYVLGGSGGGGGGQSASEVAALIAGTEYSSTASQAYSKGDYFIFNGSLMVATANIASGGTITVGTNCEAVTVGEELAEVKGSLNTLETYEAYRVTGTISSSSLAITKSGVTADMVPVACEFGTPANVLSNYTITTAANKITFSGITLSGSTTVDVILIKAN